MKEDIVNNELAVSIQAISNKIGISYETIMKHIIHHEIFVIRNKNNGVYYLNVYMAIKFLNILNEKRYNNTIKYKIKDAIKYLTNVKPLIRSVYSYNRLYIELTDLLKVLTNDQIFSNHSHDYLSYFMEISIYYNNIITYIDEKNNKYIKYDDAILQINYLKSTFSEYSDKYDTILEHIKNIPGNKSNTPPVQSTETTQSNKPNTYNSDKVTPKESPDKKQVKMSSIFDVISNIQNKVESSNTSVQPPKTPKTNDIKTDNTTDTNVLSFREYSCGKKIRNNLIALVKKIGKKLDVPTYMLWSFIYEKFFNTYPQLDKKVLDINYRGNYAIIDYIVDVHMICKLEKMINSLDEWIDKPNKTINDYPIM